MTAGKTLEDFDSNANAVACVSEHLTVALPPGATITAFQYDRFQEWHLRATATVPSAEAYLDAVRANRDPPSPPYCEDVSETFEVSYYLRKWDGCGTVRVVDATAVEITCGTR